MNKTVNLLIHDPFLARLLTLEISRMGLEPLVSATPVKGCRAYIVEGDRPHIKTPQELTVRLGGSAPESLPIPFLLIDLRRLLGKILIPSPPKPAHPKKVKRLSLSLDAEKKTATLGGTPIKLSHTEFGLLALLMKTGDTPLSSKDTIELLGQDDPNRLHVYICLLRRKLEKGDLRLIRTVRGQGYILNLPQRP